MMVEHSSVSVTILFMQDTVSTLNFAKKGMKIVNRPFVTEVEESKPKRGTCGGGGLVSVGGE